MAEIPWTGDGGRGGVGCGGGGGGACLTLHCHLQKDDALRLAAKRAMLLLHPL